MHVADALDARIAATGSIACVGLDPRPELLPPEIVERHRTAPGTAAERVAAAFADANRRVIDVVAERCAAVKPQSACYEAYGLAGWRALTETVAHARAAGVPVILDAKRGDIGSTAAHYGQMAFGGAPDLDGAPVGGIGADWITVNGYLGSDGVEPILDADDTRGAFVLVKTSNPGSGELQDLLAGGDATVADRMAERVASWGSSRLGRSGLSAIGAVVGATFPDHARALRERMPDTIFLVPGYGAQGGTAADAVAGLRPDGRGVLVSSSRGITGAWRDGGDLATAARRALDAMNAELDAVR